MEMITYKHFTIITSKFQRIKLGLCILNFNNSELIDYNWYSIINNIHLLARIKSYKYSILHYRPSIKK